MGRLTGASECRVSACALERFQHLLSLEMATWQVVHRTLSCPQRIFIVSLEIREAVDDLANTQDSALLASYGIVDEESSSGSESESSDELPVDIDNQKCSFSDTFLIDTLKKSEYNWFELVERIEAEAQENTEGISKGVEGFYKRISQLGLTDMELQKVDISHSAFLAAQDDMQSEERICRVINGEVVTDTESDDPEAYAGLKNGFSKTSLSKASIDLVKKKRIAIRRRASRLRVKMISEKDFYIESVPSGKIGSYLNAPILVMS